MEQRIISPGEFFTEACDEKFTDEDLNDEGNAFTQEYYDSKTGPYLNDYSQLLEVISRPFITSPTLGRITTV